MKKIEILTQGVQFVHTAFLFSWVLFISVFRSVFRGSYRHSCGQQFFDQSLSFRLFCSFGGLLIHFDFLCLQLGHFFLSGFRFVFFIFQIRFFSSTSYWIASTSLVRVWIMDYFSSIQDAKSDLGKLLLPLVLDIFVTSTRYNIQLLLPG